MFNKSRNGPQEVWGSLSNSKLKDRVIVVKKNHSTWPEKGSNVVVVKDYLYQLPKNLIEKLKYCNLLLGPNIDFSLELNKKIYDDFPNKKVLVPSHWIIPYLKYKTDIESKNVRVWVSGIDHKYWYRSNFNENTNRNVLLYLKDNYDMKLVKQYSKILEEKGFLVSQFMYGHYKQPHYKRELAKSKFMIWCGGTESQSIAQFQSWAMDVPTLVLKKEIFIENLSQFKASSSPYLTDSTGTFFDSNSQPEKVINSWLAKIHTFSPRKWLQDNYTIELAFMNLTKIFNEYGN